MSILRGNLRFDKQLAGAEPARSSRAALRTLCQLAIAWGHWTHRRNKAILVPTALAISAFAPWLVTSLLMPGGAYLCFEGVEKLAHPWLHETAPRSACASPV
jgi:hypothetical protein